ncbi:MAG: cyclic nucleotide-binding domain-containing protein [Verrucomicrobiota bacterium]
MPDPDDLIHNLFLRDDDEGLFSRDLNGQLVRLDAPTESDYEKTITLQIDGSPVTVPLAVPLKDANGNVLVDLDGLTTPHYTTIYDAAVQLYVRQPGDEAKIPIPILCHQPHMTPVAVCRLCVVQIYGQKRGQRAAERKLLPACQHPVKDGMEVFTIEDPGRDGDRVRQAVKVVAELLTADHLKPAPAPALTAELAPHNELAKVASKCGAIAERLQLAELSLPAPPAPPQIGRRSFDDSSPVFIVDHSACILCDRCVRACGEVKGNDVLGRTGKGATAGVSFDLNDPMGSSSCVQCGECMVSCPTSAITFKPVAHLKSPKHSSHSQPLTATDLIDDPLFAGIPPKFLLWQQGLAVRRTLAPGEVICHQGDAGNTAFIIKSGRLEVSVYPTSSAEKKSPNRQLPPIVRFQLSPKNIIAGEMSCLSGAPRAADLAALEPSEIWEIRRNVLDRLMRLPSQRSRFEKEYRERALDLVLQSSELFQGIEPAPFKEIVDFLRHRIHFVRVNPDQILFSQGDPVDHLYFIRLGHIRVAVRQFGDESRVLSRGPGSILGEIGLLSLSSSDHQKSLDDADLAIAQALENTALPIEDRIPAGRRSATCSALGSVELARLHRQDFLELLLRFPLLRRRFAHQALSRLQSDQKQDPLTQEYVAQGLYEGRSVLVLDLDLCTRCDECTKGCVDQHGNSSHGAPLTRMLRDGVRFDHYLVATSCRSCTDAHCLVGCPVDSIHRGKHLQIVIEDHCIGCGLCADNCPYGSIFMMPNQSSHSLSASTAHPQKAAACDLCDAEGDRHSPDPRCVAACPHEAAHRMTGDQLLQRVTAQFSAPKA